MAAAVKSPAVGSDVFRGDRDPLISEFFDSEHRLDRLPAARHRTWALLAPQRRWLIIGLYPSFPNSVST